MLEWLKGLGERRKGMATYRQNGGGYVGVRPLTNEVRPFLFLIPVASSVRTVAM